MTDSPALLPTPPADKADLPNHPAGDRAAERADRLGATDTDARRGGLLPILCAVGFVLLAIAIYYVWDSAQDLAGTPEIRGLASRVAALESRTPPDIGPLESRLSALEHRPVPAAAPAPDAATKSDLAALASKTDLTQLAARVDALSSRTDQLAGTGRTAAEAEAHRIDGMDSKLAELSKAQAGDAALADKLDALEQRVAALEKAAGSLPAVAERSARLAKLQAAAAALDAGQPLGDLPGAPPELARYAATKPPTLAALKLSFPAAMQAAEEASIPSPAQAGLLDRMWDRVQGLVVVRQGDSVVVGNPAAGTLARAHQQLDAGDLAGAVQSVETLHGPAAAAMAPWLEQAKDLLAARSAMAALAAHA